MNNSYLDKYTKQAKKSTASFDDGQVVVLGTPFSNSNVSRGIMVTVGGDISFKTASETFLVIPGLTAGYVYPCRTTEIAVAGTTATGIIAVW